MYATFNQYNMRKYTIPHSINIFSIHKTHFKYSSSSGMVRNAQRRVHDQHRVWNLCIAKQKGIAFVNVVKLINIYNIYRVKSPWIVLYFILYTTIDTLLNNRFIQKSVIVLYEINYSFILSPINVKMHVQVWIK